MQDKRLLPRYSGNPEVHHQWLNMEIDGEEKLVISLLQSQASSQLVEMNKKYTRKMLTNIIVLLAILVFTLHIMYTAWMLNFYSTTIELNRWFITLYFI